MCWQQKQTLSSPGSKMSFFRRAKRDGRICGQMAAQPARMGPALPSDPPLAFGSRRMTASAFSATRRFIRWAGIESAAKITKKRTAACASHASRLVKCDVLKLRHDPFGSGAAAAFPSVPPTKSGEFAHLSRTGRHGGVLKAEALSQIPGKGPDTARTCVRVLLQQTPKAACALHIALCRCT